MQSLQAPKERDMSQGFDLLVLPEDHKQIIESQVREHFRKRGQQGLRGGDTEDIDLVRGKGQGLIILLHGTDSSLNILLYWSNSIQAHQGSARLALPNASPN